MNSIVQPAASTAVTTTTTTTTTTSTTSKHKTAMWKNLLIGAGIQVFEVSTLGQPFEVIKTQMASHRSDSLIISIRNIYQRGGGLAGFYQGLIPWGWIEASTKGAVLFLASSEIDRFLRTNWSFSHSASGIAAGMGGGVIQAYTTMGFCTFMKTVEVTRQKNIPHLGAVSSTTTKIAWNILREKGIVGINKGVSAVALRQMTNWGSRFGISRITESIMRGDNKEKTLTTLERLSASVIGGALGCWNQPIEVIRVEMQSQTRDPTRPANLNVISTARYIFQRDGIRGLYRGILPRIGLSVYLTICMVFGGDQIKEKFK